MSKNWKWFRAALLTLLVLGPAALMPLAPAQAGDGIVLTSFSATSYDGAMASFLDADGRIVVAANSWTPGSSLMWGGGHFAVLRYLSDGTLDPGFGIGGMVLTPVTAAGDGPSAAAAYPAPSEDEPDRIVLAGSACSRVKVRGWWTYPSDFALARYNSLGSLDNTFNYQAPSKNRKSATFGTVVTDLGGTGDGIVGVVVQPVQLAGGQLENRIFVAGASDASGVPRLALACYLPSGQLDAQFGTGGIVRGSFGGTGDGAGHIALQPPPVGETSPKIIVGGSRSPDDGFGLARYDLQGNLDMSFGEDGNGIATGYPGLYHGGMAIDSQGNIFMGGALWYVTETGGVTSDMIVVKFFADGSKGTDFGVGGVARLEGVGLDSPGALAIQPADQKIVAAGFARAVVDPSTGQWGSCFCVARFNRDGTLDTGFNVTGVVVTPIVPITNGKVSVRWSHLGISTLESVWVRN